jgi:hypothetical protein
MVRRGKASQCLLNAFWTVDAQVGFELDASCPNHTFKTQAERAHPATARLDSSLMATGFGPSPGVALLPRLLRAFLSSSSASPKVAPSYRSAHVFVQQAEACCWPVTRPSLRGVPPRGSG